MKFGKRILSERIPGWLEYYLDYKALKKIISSVTPSHHTSYEALNEQTTQTTSMSPADVFRGVATPVQPLWESSPSLGGSPSTLSAKWAASSSLDYDRGPGFQMKKATFFFKLQRELDKINAFYLQKEAELKLRMITLLSKRQAAASRISLDTEEPDSIKDHAEWKAVVEGFTLLQNDLLKLQQFVDINATGFRKILKKWDKRSKSTTKELYLTRQVEVQPVFNRQLITEFSDTVAACLLNLTDTTIPISPALQEELSIHDSVLNAQLMREPLTRSRVFADLEENMRKAVADNDASAVQHTLATAKELLDAPDGKTFVARTIWRAAIDAEPAIADLILDSPDTPCDFRFVDDINGRTCMHEAAAAGALRLIDMCIAKGVEVNRRDSYGRTSLHYAVIGGHIACVSRLLAANADPLVLDMDNFSCLYYGVSYGHLECVRVLLQTGGVGVETTTEDDEANPLSLACRYGHSDIALLFLERGARQLPNTNGQLPIHLAAGAGHIEVCQLLANRAKETLDVKDKLNEWTPLFHAAREGRAPIVKILLSAGCNPDTVDELGRIPIFYAGWYGHVDCVQLLLHTQQSPGRAQSSTKKLPDTAPKSKPLVQTEDVDMDPDLIPSLSLPPPIMPFRIYGHNYLDKQYMVRITLGRPYSKFNEKREAPVIINAWSSDYPPSTPKAQPQSLLKMVMTSRSDASAVPVSLTVPLSEERDVVTFQVQDLAELSLEFSFYPRYGSRTIGRAAVLSSVFESIKSSRIIALAILDHRLHIIGRVIFEACVIRPFDAATLQVGGAVETYWKSLCHFAEKDNELITSPQSALDSTHTSPSNRSVLMNPSGSMAISSLSREFLTVVVQCTRDMVPVIHPEWDLPIEGLDIGVADVTCPQFERIALREKGQHNSTPPLPTATIQQWADWAGNAMITLDTILATVPVDIGINLQVAYPNRAIREAYGLGHYLDLNVYIESILLVIYKAASTYARRRISFVSFSPSICTALNWKQPNYPVFFASHCGMPEVERAKWRPPRPEPETDRRCISVAAAIEFAQANNLLGVFLNAQLLMQVPALMPGIKDVGLLLGVLGAYGDGDRPQIGPVHLLSQPDATWADGVIRFVDNTALAVQ